MLAMTMCPPCTPCMVYMHAADVCASIPVNVSLAHRNHPSLTVAAGVTEWTAVTADAMFASTMESELSLSRAEVANIVIGNWQDPSFLAGHTYNNTIMVLPKLVTTSYFCRLLCLNM